MRVRCVQTNLGKKIETCAHTVSFCWLLVCSIADIGSRLVRYFLAWPVSIELEIVADCGLYYDRGCRFRKQYPAGLSRLILQVKLPVMGEMSIKIKRALYGGILILIDILIFILRLLLRRDFIQHSACFCH